MTNNLDFSREDLEKEFNDAWINCQITEQMWENAELVIGIIKKIQESSKQIRDNVETWRRQQISWENIKKLDDGYNSTTDFIDCSFTEIGNPNIEFHRSTFNWCNFDDLLIHEVFFDECDLWKLTFERNEASILRFRNSDVSWVKFNSSKVFRYEQSFPWKIIHDSTKEESTWIKWVENIVFKEHFNSAKKSRINQITKEDWEINQNDLFLDFTENLETNFVRSLSINTGKGKQKLTWLIYFIDWELYISFSYNIEFEDWQKFWKDCLYQIWEELLSEKQKRLLEEEKQEFIGQSLKNNRIDLNLDDLWPVTFSFSRPLNMEFLETNGELEEYYNITSIKENVIWEQWLSYKDSERQASTWINTIMELWYKTFFEVIRKPEDEDTLRSSIMWLLNNRKYYHLLYTKEEFEGEKLWDYLGLPLDLQIYLIQEFVRRGIKLEK